MMALPPFKGSGTGARPRVGRRVRVGAPVRVKGMVHVRTNHWHGQHHSDLQFEYCKPPSLDIPVVSLGGHGLLRFGFKRDELDAPGPIDCPEHALEVRNALPQGVGYAIPPHVTTRGGKAGLRNTPGWERG